MCKNDANFNIIYDLECRTMKKRVDMKSLKALFALVLTLSMLLGMMPAGMIVLGADETEQQSPEEVVVAANTLTDSPPPEPEAPPPPPPPPE